LTSFLTFAKTRLNIKAAHLYLLFHLRLRTIGKGQHAGVVWSTLRTIWWWFGRLVG